MKISDTVLKNLYSREIHAISYQPTSSENILKVQSPKYTSHINKNLQLFLDKTSTSTRSISRRHRSLLPQPPLHEGGQIIRRDSRAISFQMSLSSFPCESENEPWRGPTGSRYRGDWRWTLPGREQGEAGQLNRLPAARRNRPPLPVSLIYQRDDAWPRFSAGPG